MSIRSPDDSVLAGSVKEPEELAQLMERICSSRHFRRSNRLSTFLTFICNETLAGHADAICEQTIGHRVFGRPPAYDPTSDNIVRVEAIQLRKRLESYFTEEGSQEPIIIKVPKGGYVPVFEAAQPQVAEPPPVRPPLPAPVPPQETQQNQSKRKFLLLLGALALVLAIVGGLATYRWFGQPQSSAIVAPQSELPPRFTAFWARFFDDDQPILFCVADSNLSLLQDLRKDAITLSDYTSGRYMGQIKTEAGNGESGRILSELATRSFTSLGDATAIARLMMVNRKRSPVTVRSARDVNIRDLRSGNTVFLGSARSNPWVDLLGQNRRFQIGHDIKLNLPTLRDKNPEPGKPSVYLGGVKGDKPYDAYGIASVVPNLDGTGTAILVAGSNMEGTEAATEFLTNPDTLEAFLEKIEWAPDDPLPVFEVVVKLVTIGGSPTSSQIFAHNVERR